MANDTTATQVYTFRDNRGHTARVKFYITYDSGIPADAKTRCVAIRTQLVAMSNTALIKGTGPDAFIFDPNTFGGNAQYPSAETKLRFTYQCGTAGPPVASTNHKMDIPGPVVAAFNTDLETALNGVGSPLALLIVALKGVTGTAIVSNADGEPVLHGLGGLLVRRKFQRKETIYSKLPDLSGFQL